MGFIAPALSVEWGIPRASLGPVMSAALGGMVFGALGSGPLADRFGRKGVLVVATFIFGGFSLLSAFSANLEQLVILRFLTGLGLGAAMPNATTLLSEYTPERLKSLLVTSMFCGFNLGMAGGGFVSAWMIPAYGWHSLLVLGGVLPLALAVVLLLWLPESARYLVVHGKSAERIRRVLAPIGREAAEARHFVVPEQKSVKTGNVFAVIFNRNYSAGTLLLWLTYFMGLVIVYLLTSWLPTLMRDAGASLEQAALIGALFQFGGGAQRGVRRLGHGQIQSAQGDRPVLCAGWDLRLLRGPEPGPGRPGRHPGAGGRHVHQRRPVGHAVAGGALLPDPWPRHRGVLDARHRPLRRHHRRLDGRDPAGPGLDLHPGAHRAAPAGRSCRPGGIDQGRGQPRRCHLASTASPLPVAGARRRRCHRVKLHPLHAPQSPV